MPIAIDGNGALTGITSLVTNLPTINGAPFLHLNDIINGDFRIAQAGTSFAAAATGAYDLDGWRNNNTTTAVFTVAQAAGSTAGRLARQVTITTADAAVAAADIATDEIRIEGYNIEKYVGNTFTIAFRAKVPVTGIHCVATKNTGADRYYVTEINFPTANVWQNCSFTVTGGLPTAGTWNYTTGVGIELHFIHMCGTDRQTATVNAWATGNLFATVNQVNDCATVGNVWALEKVTLNLGTVAAVSEISVEAELIRCQRYFELLVSHVLFTATAASQYAASRSFFRAAKRSAPTITFAVISSANNGGATAIQNTVDGVSVYILSSAAGVTENILNLTAASRL